MVVRRTPSGRSREVGVLTVANLPDDVPQNLDTTSANRQSALITRPCAGSRRADHEVPRRISAHLVTRSRAGSPRADQEALRWVSSDWFSRALRSRPARVRRRRLDLLAPPAGWP